MPMGIMLNLLLFLLLECVLGYMPQSRIKAPHLNVLSKKLALSDTMDVSLRNANQLLICLNPTSKSTVFGNHIKAYQKYDIKFI